ncbi:MAG: hypothetical protein LBU32_02280 [Clostridiales bacterium]|jgi:hypothetical protein|nr:hypothetical protein [Clostridiales bacterium]
MSYIHRLASALVLFIDKSDEAYAKEIEEGARNENRSKHTGAEGGADLERHG